MADMLKFKLGLYNDLTLEKVPVAPGTVYVTADEKAMYVDVPAIVKDGEEKVAASRIRIGDFIRVDTVEDIIPPFSTSSLYYVEADNALLKYDGSAWKQVNGTDGLREAVAGIEEDIEGINSTLTTHGTDIEALKAAVGMNEEGEVEGLAGTVAQLRKDLNALDGEVDGLADTVSTQGETLGTLGETVSGHTTTLEGYGSRIGDLETASAKHAEKTYVDETFAKKADIQGTLAKVDTEGTVSAAIEAAVAAEAAIARAAEEANAKAIQDANSAINDRVTTTVFNQFKTDNTAAIGTAKSEAISEANGYTDGKITAEVTRADATYAPKSVVSTVEGHTSTLNTLTGDGAGSVKEAKDRADAAYALAESRPTLETVKSEAQKAAAAAANGKDEAIQAAKDAADAAKSAADDAQADATEALNKIGDASNGLVKDIADNKAAVEAAQKDIDDYQEAHKDDYDNDAIDAAVKVAKDAADAAKSAADEADAKAVQAGKDAAAAQATADAAVTKESFAEFQEANTAAIEDAKKAGTDAQATADANAKAIEDLQSAVDTLNGNAETEGSVAKAVADAKAELEDTIAEEINAANAMNYIAGVSAFSELPTQAPAGATYVVTELVDSFKVNGEQVYPGDLLIATGEEDLTVTDDKGMALIPEGSLSWTVVRTGYDASLEQTLSGDENKITLTSVTGAKSEVTFASVGENEAGVVTEVKDNTVTIGIQWGTF